VLLQCNARNGPIWRFNAAATRPEPNTLHGTQRASGNFRVVPQLSSLTASQYRPGAPDLCLLRRNMTT
jgi:hypothetical protein